MAIQLRPEERDPAMMVQAIIQLAQGRMAAIGSCTLGASVGSTFVEFVNCSSECAVFLFPQTANAAAEVPNMYIGAGDVVNGGFTIKHSVSVLTDRRYWFLCIGG